MAIPKRKLIALGLSVAFITGCTSVKVIRNPDDADEGVRYYRPKPYLLVTPADPTGRLVNMKLEYLPDFNEEYSVHLRGKASVALKDGWNLVGVNTKEAPKEEEKPPAKIEAIPLPPAVVSATNVPIGYYESVYGMAGSKKFLQGWRYIGMTILGGGQPNVCRVPGHNPNCPPGAAGTNGCITGPLYGLVFFNGVMTFRQLDEIANNQLCPMYVNPTPAEAAATPPVNPGPGKIEIDRDQIKGKIEIDRDKAPTTGTPPLPIPAVPPTTQVRPKVTPALVTARPAASASPARPTMPPTTVAASTAKPAAPKPAATTVAKKPASPAPAPVVAAGPLKATPPKPVAANPAGLGQDPLMGIPPSLDQDLFRTSSSLRP